MKNLEQVLEIVGARTDAALLPGGFFSTYSEPRTLYETIETNVSALLRDASRLQFVCIGIDGREGEDQGAVVVSKSGIVAAGRKFHPAPGEAGFIKTAASYTSGEDGYPRIFNVKGRNAFPAVCYDSFGWRHGRPSFRWMPESTIT
jgi:predicted amidohydrolase